MNIKQLKNDILKNSGATINTKYNHAVVNYVSAFYGNETKIHKSIFELENFDFKGLLKSYKDEAIKTNSLIGFWYNEEDNNIYIDLSKNFNNKEECLNFGRNQEQIAIFDAINFNEIKC